MSSRLDEDYAYQFPGDFAHELRSGDVPEVAAVLTDLPAAIAAGVAAHLPANLLVELCQPGYRELMQRMLEAASLNGAIALLVKLPRQRVLTLVNQLPNAKRRGRLLQYLNYPPHSVGAVVSHEPVVVREDATLLELKDALAERGVVEDPEVIVVTEAGGYAGVVNPWRLLGADANTLHAAQAIQTPEPLRAATSLGNALGDAQWDRRAWLPVVDHNGRVVGACRRWMLSEPSSLAAQPRGGPVAQVAVAGMGVLGQMLETLLGRRIHRGSK